MSHHLHEFWKARAFWKAKTTILKTHSVAMCQKCHQNNENHHRKTVNIGKILSRTTSSPTLGSIVERLAHFNFLKKYHTGREHKRKNISLVFVLNHGRVIPPIYGKICGGGGFRLLPAVWAQSRAEKRTII